ncbi:MAG: NAD(P)-dependent glycerol-3-phosphate dehydrogenase [Hyphomicrobiales bacterium]|nr:NAD(P)-dependent glycerol-3-phosphate dehydrogenase [Hyphomicrobiales bacterium]
MKDATIDSVAVIGAGAWGSALANAIASQGRQVVIWAREAEVVESINRKRENDIFLPGVTLAPSIRATGDIADVASADAVFLAAPAQHIRNTAMALASCVGERSPILVLCAKGIEEGSLKLLSQVLDEIFNDINAVALSGPTLAGEVARGLPTALVVACENEDTGKAVMEVVHGAALRPYLSDDITGVQIGGALKNIFAIACGIVIGRELGENAHAALLSRGFAEMLEYGAAVGARRETLMGLSGLGDLVLTCNARTSRNMSLGMALGRGESLEEVLKRRRSVSEGVFTARAACELGGKLGVSMPIIEALSGVLFAGESVDTGIERLLARPLRRE